MGSYLIHGGNRLMGEVPISGSGLAALPMLGACLMAEGPTTLAGVPRTTDVLDLCRVLEELGCRVQWQGTQDGALATDGTLTIEVLDEEPCRPACGLVNSLRATARSMGPLLAKRGRFVLCDPAASVIGESVVLKRCQGIFRQMGGEFRMEYGNLVGEAPGKSGAPWLRGCRLSLEPSKRLTVLDTANVMCAAVLAEGQTTIIGAPCEPEITECADLLNAMGARIRGAGTPELTIDGVQRLVGCHHRLMPDRIECGLWMVAASITRGELTLRPCEPRHLTAEIDLLNEIGAEMHIEQDALSIALSRRPRAVMMTTAEYPGSPRTSSLRSWRCCALRKGPAT